MPHIKPQSIGRFAAAAVGYAVFAFVLLRPHWFSLLGYKCLYAFWPIAAACGMYTLSRRWISSWIASLFAGAVYGFGPYGLSFLKLHPATGVVFAAIPWLFMPAVWWHQGASPTVGRWLVRGLFCLLPLAFEIVIVWLLALPIFSIPLSAGNAPMQLNDLLGLLNPFAFSDKPLIFGIYPVCLSLTLFGAIIYLLSQRIALLILPMLGLILSFFDPIARVSPYFWLTFPILFLSVVCGIGIQGLMVAGKPDRRWVGMILAALLALTGWFGWQYLQTKATVALLTCCLYGLSALFFAFEWICLTQNWRLRQIRQTLLLVIAGADLYLGANWLINTIF